MTGIVALPTWLLALAFVVLWNSGFVGAEFALPNTAPLTLLFWRYGLVVLAVLVYLILRRRLHWPGVKPVAVAAVVGVLAHGVWLGCVFYSLQYGVPAGIVALVVALQPMATGALSGWVTGERTTRMGWLGLSIGFLGVIIAVLARTDLSDGASIFAFFIPFGSVVAITVASLLQRRLELERRATRMAIDLSLFYQALAVALVVTLPALVLEDLAVRWTASFIGSMLWLVVAVSVVAYALMWALIARIDATRVASLFYFGPPVTMLMAWAAFGDSIRATDLLGFGVVAGGVVLIHLQTARTGGMPKEDPRRDLPN